MLVLDRQRADVHMFDGMQHVAAAPVILRLYADRVHFGAIGRPSLSNQRKWEYTANGAHVFQDMLITLCHLRRREHMALWVHRKLSRETLSRAREVDMELRSRHSAAFVEREDAARTIERIVGLLVEANATGATR
jgi:hypothetical protein